LPKCNSRREAGRELIAVGYRHRTAGRCAKGRPGASLSLDRRAGLALFCLAALAMVVFWLYFGPILFLTLAIQSGAALDLLRAFP
jgi:hypothetical protein